MPVFNQMVPGTKEEIGKKKENQLYELKVLLYSTDHQIWQISLITDFKFEDMFWTGKKRQMKSPYLFLL